MNLKSFLAAEKGAHIATIVGPGLEFLGNTGVVFVVLSGAINSENSCILLIYKEVRSIV